MFEDTRRQFVRRYRKAELFVKTRTYTQAKEKLTQNGVVILKGKVHFRTTNQIIGKKTSDSILLKTSINIYII